MKTFVLKSTIALALLGSVIAFTSPAHADSETLGTLGGAAAGGLIGNQFGKGGGNIAATVGGVIAGGVIGNAIGRDADESRYRSYGQPAYAPAPAQTYSYYESPPATVYTAPAPVYYQPAPTTVIYERPAPPPVVVYERPYRQHYRYYRPYYGY
jgi:predicted lipid-binding transport protein (Tim44 family)